MKCSSFSVLKGIAIAFIVVLFTSCAREESTDVNQDRIYAEYELYYDKNTDKTYASAIFRFGNATGTQLELSAPSEVRFNGDVIPFDAAFAYYRKEYAGPVTSGTFVFTDTEGNSFTNSVGSTRTIAFPSVDTIHNSGSFTLAWIGDNVVANERVDVWMDGPLQNNAEFFTQYLANTNSMVLAANQLQQLGTGSTTCTMERIWEENAAQVTGAGGKVRVKYKALNRVIQVVP
jgi:hypothetical protein